MKKKFFSLAEPSDTNIQISKFVDDVIWENGEKLFSVQMFSNLFVAIYKTSAKPPVLMFSKTLTLAFTFDFPNHDMNFLFIYIVVECRHAIIYN